MQPFDDDLMPAESDPQNKEIIAFLRLVSTAQTGREESATEQEKLAVGHVRQRLFADQALSSASVPDWQEISEDNSPLSQWHVLPEQKRGWSRRIALLAATLAIALLAGSLLIVSHLANQTSFVAGTPPQAIYALSGGWLQKFDIQSGRSLWKSHVQTSAGQENPGIFTPASNGVVYFTAGQQISALRAGDGSVIWHTSLHGETVIRMIYENSMLFILTQQTGENSNYHTTLEALDASSGNQVWQYTQMGLFSSFAVVNSVVYGGIDLNVSSANRNNVYAKFDLFALKATNGSVLWRVHMQDPLLVSTSGEITVANGKVYVGASTLEETKNSAHGYNHLYAYSASDGAFLWSTPDALNLFPRPLLAGPSTVFATSGASLYALQEQNGQLLWHYENKDGGALHCSLSSQARNIFCLQTEGASTYLVELRASDGQEVTRHLVEHFGIEAIPVTLSLPATAGNTPQPATRRSSLLLFPTLLTGPQVSFVVTPTGYLDVFDNQSGQRLWSKQLMGMPGPVNLIPEN